MVKISVEETSTRTQWIYILHSVNIYILCCCFPFIIFATSFILDVLSVHVWFTATGIPFGFLFCLLTVVMLFLFLFPFLTCLLQTLICITLLRQLRSWSSPAWKKIYTSIYTPTQLSSKTVKKYHKKKVQNIYSLHLFSLYFFEKVAVTYTAKVI